jgi:hypothetical protein
VSAKADITIFQGDDFSRTFGVFDANGWPAVLTTDGTLTGGAYTAQAQLRRDFADTDTTIDATFSCVVAPVGSRVTISLNAATTTGLVNGPYRYDVQVTNPSTSAKTTVAYGRAFIQLEATR